MFKLALSFTLLVIPKIALADDFVDFIFSNQASEYDLREIAAEEIAEESIIADGASGIPERLQGIWWLDGNPVATSILLSFGKGDWNPEERTLTMPVYGENIWAWEGSEEGRTTYEFVFGTGLVYELQLNQDLTEGEVIPIVTIAGFQVRVPTRFFTIGLRYVEDGYWIRDTYLFGKKVDEYDFRRIINSEGMKEDAFQDFLDRGPETLFIAG
ncbi:MAG: hypothetical protein ACOH5I_15700 [Oligoflexus sp.]